MFVRVDRCFSSDRLPAWWSSSTVVLYSQLFSVPGRFICTSQRTTVFTDHIVVRVEHSVGCVWVFVFG